jgi:hypothetical protein
MKKIFKICIVMLLLAACGLSAVAGAMQGDANGDGKINTVDYAVIKRAVMGRYELSEAGSIAADVNYDGNVNALDYMIVKRVVLGIAVFPHRHDYEEVVVGNLHIFTCKSCGHQYEEFDGQLIG